MVKCQKCEHINDIDKKFCEKCGKFLGNLESGSIYTNKILLICFIVLVIGIAVSAGALLTNNTPKQPIINNSTPQNTSNENQTKTAENTLSNQTKLISASEAVDIANNYAAQYDEESNGQISFINTTKRGISGNPYYHVGLKYKPRNYGNSDDILIAAFVEIDATNGAIISLWYH
jgi:hypothetical protein